MIARCRDKFLAAARSLCSLLLFVISAVFLAGGDCSADVHPCFNFFLDCKYEPSGPTSVPCRFLLPDRSAQRELSFFDSMSGTVI